MQTLALKPQTQRGRLAYNSYFAVRSRSGSYQLTNKDSLTYYQCRC